MRHKAQLLAAVQEQDRAQQNKRDSSVSCQIITVRDLQDFQSQVLSLERDLQQEKQRVSDMREHLSSKDTEFKSQLSQREG